METPSAGAARNAAEDAVIPPLTFNLPWGFRQLPLSADAEERAAAVRELADEVYPSADEQARTAAAVIYELMTAVLGASGVEFAAFGLFDDGAGGVAHGSLTVAAISSEHASAEAAANGLREVFARDPMRDTRWLDLPCGPAVAVVSMRAIAVQGAAAATPADQGTADGEPGVPAARGELTIGQIQAHIPFPNDPWISVFTFETSALEQWDQMCVLMADIVKTVRFTGAPAVTGAPVVTSQPASSRVLRQSRYRRDPAVPMTRR